MNRLAVLLLLIATPALAQFNPKVRVITVASLPSACEPGRIYNVHDGASSTDVATGGGETAVWAICDAGGASYTGVSSTASGFTPNADPGVDHSSYVAGHTDGANCAAGSYPLGVDASGATQSCTDASTETDSIVATHTAISGAHHTLFAPTAGVATDHGAESVALTDLADGTDGELITWDATGEAVTVAVGTATHVLTSNGVGAAPTFQAAAGGGISNVVEDLTPQLGGTLDMNSQFISGDVGLGGAPGGTLDVAGEIRITGDDAFASDVAQLYTTTASGLVITGHAGSTTDLLITDGSGSTLIKNPAGTKNLVLAEEVSATLTLGSSTGTVTVPGILSLTPKASAPGTCSIGDFYVDTSGAACACSATNTWSNMHATGSCT